MLTRLDDYLAHQIPDTFDHVGSSDRNFYDRYYFNCHDLSGETFLVVAMGAYPNIGVIDAFVTCVRKNERQHIVRASRELGSDRSDTTVGPIGVEVVEGLRKLRVWCDKNDWDITFELTFEGFTFPFEEPHFLRRNGSRVVMDYRRLTQVGRWSGTLEVAGERFQVDQDKWRGARDHSWGIRSVGDREPASAPARNGARGFYWNWSPLQFDDFAIMYTVSENHDGSRWHEAAAKLFPYASGKEPENLSVIRHDFNLRPQTRLFNGGNAVLYESDGREVELSFEPLSLLHMAGAGYAYGGDLWRHGQYRGALAVEGETWDIADPQLVAKVAGQNEVVVCKATYGGQLGYGIFEFILFGLYEPYGFKSLTDVAP